jgi:hypothetical protein
VIFCENQSRPLTAALFRRKPDYMTGDPSPSPFDLATTELRALGITLTRLPGEYAVSYRNSRESTAHMADTLDEAIALGRSMAAAAPVSTAPPQGKRRRRPLRMTPKAIRRRAIKGAQSPHARADAQEAARGQLNHRSRIAPAESRKDSLRRCSPVAVAELSHFPKCCVSFLERHRILSEARPAREVIRARVQQTGSFIAPTKQKPAREAGLHFRANPENFVGVAATRFPELSPDCKSFLATGLRA